MYAQTEEADKKVVERLGEVAEQRGVPQAQAGAGVAAEQAGDYGADCGRDQAASSGGCGGGVGGEADAEEIEVAGGAVCAARGVWVAVDDLVVVGVGVGHGVVAFAGLDFLALPAGDVEGAEGAVDLGVGGGVAGEVLGAELVLNLVEGFFELLAVVAYVDDAAAGVGGEAAPCRGRRCRRG